MSRALRALVVLSFAFVVAIVIRASLPVVQTGQWVAGPNLGDVRDGASSVLLNNGDLLVAGGRNSAGALQTADLVHADGTVTTAAPMLNARARHTATLLPDGRVLVAGGDSGNGAAINAAEVYDPASDTWAAVGPLGFARFGHTALQLKDGRVAVVGGENNGSPIAAIEIFDPASNSFSQPASLQNARKDQAAALLSDGRILVAGGFGLDAQGNAVALNSAEIFDPSTNAVSPAANMNVARGRHSATTVLDGLVIVAGGSDGQADLGSIETYTPATDSWALSAATLSVARSGHVGTLLPSNNSVLISGGTSNGNAVQIAEVYQPWTGAVVSGGTTIAPHVLGSGSPFGVEGLYLAAGGSGSNSTEFFRFATIKTDKSDYSPGTPVLMTGTGYQPNETVNLVLAQDDGDPTTTTQVTADASGNISYQGFAPDTGDVGTHFHLTAIGQTSGLQGQTTFTDANVNVFSAPAGTSFTLSFKTFNSPTVNCTGTPTNTNTQGILPNQQGNSGNVGVGNPQSVELQAPAFSDQGGAFQTWSWTTLTNESVAAVGSTTAIPTPTTTNPICIEATGSNKVNNGTFTATYSPTATAPTVTTASPNNGDLNTTENVVLTGTNFVAGSTVSFGPNIAINSTTLNSSTQITVNITIASNAATGARNVSVTNPGSGGGSATGTLANGFTVNKRTTSTSVSCTPSTVSVNTPTSCTATVTDTDTGTAITPTGNVSFASTGTGTFSAGGSCTLAGTGAIASCSVSYTPTAVGTGTHGISGTYGSDATHAGSTSTNFNVTVNSAATTTTVTLTPGSVVVGQSSSVSVSVASVGGGPTPAGSITLTSSDAADTFSSTTCTLSAGSCSVSVTPHDVGTNPHKISASYTPSDSHTASNGGADLTVAAASTTTAVNSSANPSVFGQPVTFTATVSDSSAGSTAQPTGSVQFVVDGVNFGSPVALTGATSTSSSAASGATATLAVSGSPHSVTANYVNADGNFSNSSGSLSQTVNKANSSTTLTSSLNPSVFGQSITFTATISAVAPGAGTATGTVTFLDGGNPIGSGTLSGGVATFTTSALVVGNHTITTNYGGDGNFNGSTGSLTGNPQVVNKADTATTVTSSVNPSVFGQSITFSATVSPVAPGAGTPSGTVTFLDGGNPIGSGTLSGGIATFTTSALVVGNHTITTSYGGDGNFNGSTGSLTGNPQVVNKADTATTVTSSVNPSVFGQSITFTATVSPVAPGAGTPSGTITFLDGGAPIGSGTLSGGIATFTTSALSVGNHTITTSYGGDGNFNGSTGSLTGNPQVVNKANTATTVTSSVNPSVFGQSITFSATVSPVAPGAGTPTGTVTFLDGGSPIGSGTLSGGVATFTTSALSVGNHTITTSYGGDGNFNGSTGSLTGNPQVVNKANTATTVTSSVNPSVFGQSITFTATVSPVAPGAGTPSGTITFLDGGAPIGSGTLSGGIATFTTSALSVSNHTITTSYGGDGNFNGSTGSLTGNPQVVNKANTSTALTSSTNPSIFGQSVTLTATVLPVAPGAGTPTGTVTFLDSGSPIGTGTLSGGIATFSTSALSVGTHTITASYGGDGNFNVSTSAALTEQVDYKVCLLYDPTKSVKSGATYPIKLYLCDVNNNDVSSAGIIVHAVSVTQTSVFSGTPEDAGNANPDNDFRFDSTLGPSGGYIFNLQTTGLPSGTYNLNFTAQGDANPHSVPFGVK